MLAWQILRYSVSSQAGGAWRLKAGISTGLTNWREDVDAIFKATFPCERERRDTGGKQGDQRQRTTRAGLWEGSRSKASKSLPLVTLCGLLDGSLCSPASGTETRFGRCRPYQEDLAGPCSGAVRRSVGQLVLGGSGRRPLGCRRDEPRDTWQW